MIGADISLFSFLLLFPPHHLSSSFLILRYSPSPLVSIFTILASFIRLIRILVNNISVFYLFVYRFPLTRPSVKHRRERENRARDRELIEGASPGIKAESDEADPRPRRSYEVGTVATETVLEDKRE